MTRRVESSLPDAEREVLACVLQRGEATAGQVRAALARYRPMAHGSVVTLLKRLMEKGWVSRVKAEGSRAFIYAPTRKARPLHRRVLGDLLERLFGGDGVALVASLFESRPPTAAEIERIQAMLDQCRDNTRRKSP